MILANQCRWKTAIVRWRIIHLPRVPRPRRIAKDGGINSQMAHGAQYIPVGNLVIEAAHVWIRRLVTLLPVHHRKPQESVDSGWRRHRRSRRCAY